MKFVKRPLLLSLVFVFLFSGCVREPYTRFPNIILILIDNMGWKDFASAGSIFYETSNFVMLSENVYPTDFPGKRCSLDSDHYYNFAQKQRRERQEVKEKSGN